MGDATTVLPLYRRKLDALLCVLWTYFLFSSVFIEYPVACAGEDPATSSSALLRATYDYSVAYNPLFAALPEWLRYATCYSALCMAPFYALLLVCFARGDEWVRVPGLLHLGQKMYAMQMYGWFETHGDLATPSIAGWLAADGPYYLAWLLLFYRLVVCRTLFVVRARAARTASQR